MQVNYVFLLFISGLIKTEPDQDFPPFTVKYEEDIEIDEGIVCYWIETWSALFYQLFILIQNMDFSDVPAVPVKMEPDDDFPFTVKYEDDIEIYEHPIQIKEEVSLSK